MILFYCHNRSHITCFTRLCSDQRVAVFVPFQIDVANREVDTLVVASLDNCTLFCNTNLKRKKHKKQKNPEYLDE